jgi:hypothetical protein
MERNKIMHKRTIIPMMLLIFALLGLEYQVLPYVPFGGGRWIDSVSKNTSNRSIEVRGNVNITGNYYKNGVLFSGGGGTPITGSDENAGILDEVTGLDFVGNIFSATGDTGTGLMTLTSTIDTNDFFTRFNLDTTKIGHLSENNTWTGSNSFTTGTQTIDALYITSSIVNDGLTQTDTLRITNGIDVGGPGTVSGRLTLQSIAIFQTGLQIADATKVIINSGSNILYQVTTGGAHVMQTISGTDLMKVDSANGVTLSIGTTGIGNGLLNYKLFRGVLGAAGGAETKFTHGVNVSKIVSTSWLAKNDTTIAGAGNDHWYLPNVTVAGNGAFLYDVYIDSIHVVARLRATSTGVFNDSVKCLIGYFN